MGRRALEIRTDGDAMKAARKLDVLRQEMNAIVNDFLAGDHPAATAMFDELRENGFDVYASAEDVIRGHLQNPQRWTRAEAAPT